MKGASDFKGEEFENFEFNAFQWCSNLNLVPHFNEFDLKPLLARKIQK